MQEFKKQQKKGQLRRSTKNVPNKFDWRVLNQVNLCFAASLLSLSLDAWQFATFRVLILLPASNAMSKEVQPSWEKKQQNWVHGILGKLIVLKFNPQRIAPFLAPGKNFRYKDRKISSLHSNCTYRYQFQIKKKDMHLSSSASSPITPRSVPKTSSRCSRLDNKNSNKHQTP